MLHQCLLHEHLVCPDGGASLSRTSCRRPGSKSMQRLLALPLRGLSVWTEVGYGIPVGLPQRCISTS